MSSEHDVERESRARLTATGTNTWQEQIRYSHEAEALLVAKDSLIDKFRESMRKHAIGSFMDGGKRYGVCRECWCAWYCGDDERHVVGCLAHP